MYEGSLDVSLWIFAGVGSLYFAFEFYVRVSHFVVVDGSPTIKKGACQDLIVPIIGSDM